MEPLVLLQWLYIGDLIAEPAMQIIDNFLNAGIDPTDEEMAAALAANASTTDALHAAGEHDTPVPPTE